MAKTPTTSTTNSEVADTQDVTAEAPAAETAPVAEALATEAPVAEVAPEPVVTKTTSEVALDAAVARYNIDPSKLQELKESVEAYIAGDYETSKATTAQIQGSTAALNKIYTVLLDLDPSSIAAGFNYVLRVLEAEQHKSFNVRRMNMLPSVVAGGNNSTNVFIADMNQLVRNLMKVNNASELRARLRLEPILANMRNKKQQEALSLYIASIDH